MKRFLSILLTLVLSLSVVAALPVHAEGETPFKVGEETFSTLADAYAALPEEGGTIELTADYTSANDVGLTFAKPVTIKSTDGQKYSITLSAACSNGARWITTTANLNLVNLTVNTARGIVATGADVTLTGCTVNMAIAPYANATKWDNWNTFDYDLFIMDGGKLTLDGTNVTYDCNFYINNTLGLSKSNDKATVVKINNGADLELKNESSMTKTGWASCNNAGNAVVYVSGGDAVINVGDGCSIVNSLSCQSGRNERSISCISLAGAAKGTISLTLGNGSVLSLGNSYITTHDTGKNYPGWVTVFGAYGASTGVTVTDNGCTYKVTPASFTAPSNAFTPNLIAFPTVSTEKATDVFYLSATETVENGDTMTLTTGTAYEFKFGTPDVDVAPFTVDGIGHQTLTDAVAAADAGDTIYISANYKSTNDVGIIVDKALTIKSAGTEKYKITVTAAPSPANWWISASADLTIENVDVATTRGINITGGNFLLKNSVFDMKYDYTTARDTRGDLAFIRLTGGSTATLSGATVTYELNTNNANISVGAHVVYIHGATKNTFTLTDNSSITVTSDTTNAAANTIVMIDGVNGDPNVGSKAEINVGEGCSLKNYMNMEGLFGIRPMHIITPRVNNNTVGADININLAKGSVLDIHANIVTYGTSRPGWIMGYDDGTHYTVNDNGCEYIVNSPAKKSNSGDVKDGCLMYFPPVADESGEKMFYATNAKPVANGGTMTLEANTVYTFKFGTPPASLAPLLTNIAGGSIRTDAPYGIRFGATVNKDTYNALVADGATVKFGMILAPTDSAFVFDGDFFTNYDAMVEGIDYLKTELTYDQLAADGSYIVSMYIEGHEDLAGVGADALQRRIDACAYYIIEYDDGTTETVFAENAVTRSIYDVAKAYVEGGYESIEFINNIISTVEGANA